LGARPADAEVSLLGSDHRTVIRTVRSDRTGEAVLSGVPAGDYTVLINVPGFKKMMYTSLAIESQADVVINIQLQVMIIYVDYDGDKWPPLIKQVRIKAVDTTGEPITSAHGWVISDVVAPPVLADKSGQMLFTSVPPYPGIVVSADGFQSKLLLVTTEDAGEVTLL